MKTAMSEEIGKGQETTSLPGNDLIINPISKIYCVVRFRHGATNEKKWATYDLKQRPDIFGIFVNLALGKEATHKETALSEEFIEELMNDGMLSPVKSSRSFVSKIKFRDFPANLPQYHHKNQDLFLNGNIYKLYFMLNCKKPGSLPFESKIKNRDASSALKMLLNSSKLNNSQVFAPEVLQQMVDKGFLIRRDEQSNLNGVMRKLGEKLVTDSYGGTIAAQSPGTIGKLQVSTGIHFVTDGVIPPAVSELIYNPDWVKANLPDVFIQNKTKGILSPYWLPAKQLAALKRLCSGEVSPAGLEPAEQKLFIDMQVLTPVSDAEEAGTWTKKVEAWKASQAENDCLLFNDCFSPFLLNLLSEYVDYMVKGDFLEHDKLYGTKRRYWVMNDEVTFFMQSSVCNVVNQVLKTPVKPATNYLTHYKPGAILTKHTDTGVPMCPFAVSLTLRVDPVNAKPWHLCVEANKKDHQYAMYAGDAVLFRPDSPHWRDGKLKDHTTSVMLFWFVPNEFKGSINEKYIA